MVVHDLLKHGRFFDTPQGQFVFDDVRLQTYEISKDDAGLAAVLNDRYGINPHEHGFGRVLADLKTEASLRGQKSDIHRFAHFDGATNRMYISRFNGYVYRLDGRLVESVPNGTDGAFFSDDPRWESYTYSPGAAPGKLHELLIASVNFAPWSCPSENKKSSYGHGW
jgi:hypothetical protein